MTNLGSYMDACLRESQAEANAKEVEDRIYRKLRLTNLINKAEKMSSVYQQIAELAYKRSLTTESRHRMSEQIAQELIAEAGDGAYLYCLEKLANNTQNPLLWRDVLTYLDEMKGKPNET
jgi:hypothetical protein